MNLFELFATISLDSSSYEAGLENAEKNANTAGSKIGKAISNIAKASTVAIGAAAAGVTAITKSAVDSYADYEQLVGGVETLFGTGGKTIEEYAEDVGKTVEEIKDEYYDLYTAQNTVMNNAAEAYKSAGLSANEYMDTVTSFAASLVSSVGGNTQHAASLADAAVRDMSDNANKMGTSMEAIQNAYQGFAKQNYTMLDNLKLGYGGTQSEMARLILDAEKIDETFKATRDESGDLTMSFRDIVIAIGVVQDKMGIAGTTAKEAASTISGSANAMKSAWSNLITGLANGNADMDELVTSLVDSVETMIGNIAPVVERVLKSIGPAIQKATPMLVKTISGLISSVLPSIVGIAGELITSLSQAFSENAGAIAEAGANLLIMLGQGIIDNLPLLLQTGLNIIMMIGQSIVENLPTIMESISQAINEIAVILSNPEMISALLLTVMTIIQTIGTSIIENIPLLMDTVMQVIDNIILFVTENLPKLVEMALQMMIALADGLVAAIPKVLEKIPLIIDNIANAILNLLPVIVNTGITLLTALVTALPQIINTIIQAVPQIVTSITNAITTLVPAMIDAGIQLFTALVDNLPFIIETIVDALPQIIDSLVDAFEKSGPVIVEAGVKLFTSLIENMPKILRALASGLATIMKSLFEGVGKAIPTMLEMGGQLISGLWQGISNVGEWLREKVSGFFGGVVDSIKKFFGIHSPSKVFAGIGEMLDRGLAKGVGDYAKLAVNAAEDMAEDVFAATDRDFNFTAGTAVDGRGWRSNERGVVINVYGAQGQSEEELAEIVSQKIAFYYAQEQAVFA